jgi:copper(I)-binding protein
MKQRLKFIAILTLFGACTAFAHGYKVGAIEIEHPWSRATSIAAANGAVYFTLKNSGEERDRLIAVSSTVAGKAEFHTHTIDGNIMKMRPVESIEIAPASATIFEPGGLHVMLMGLMQPLEKGKTFPLTLVFESAGPVTVQVVVQDGGASAHAHE